MLVPELIDLDYEVAVIDNFMFKQSSLNHLCYNKNFNIINGDINNELMKKLIIKNDVIIPLAAIVGAPLCNKDPFNAQHKL